MCSPKTMVKIGIVVAISLAAGFVALPQFRPAIIGLAPFALFAICPLAMFFGMRGMSGERNKEDGHHCASCGDNKKLTA